MPKNTKPQKGEKKITGWAITSTLDGFLPDIHAGHIGDIWHIHSNRKHADIFVKKCNKNSGGKYWKVTPVEIILPTK